MITVCHILIMIFHCEIYSLPLSLSLPLFLSFAPPPLSLQPSLSPSLSLSLSPSLSLPTELPSPNLASLSELTEICSKFYRKAHPTELGFSYSEIKMMDELTVNLLPEKKGTVFKHNEYLVESKVCFVHHCMCQ